MRNMLRRYTGLLGLFSRPKFGIFRAKKLQGTSERSSWDFSFKSRDGYVRIVHPGGREELYHYEVPASHMMNKYPGTCVAHPQVFRNPLESILSSEELLVPGRKYLIIPATTAQKLRRRHQKKDKVKSNQAMTVEEEVSDANIIMSSDGNSVDESISSAKDFYLSKETWSRWFENKGKKPMKPFVPPLPKTKGLRLLGWQPRLKTVHELSP